jgi:hypothetical protein
VLNEYRSRLRKGTATPADMGEVMRKAAERYFASASPLNTIKAEMDTIAEGLDRMKKAMPAFRRWALAGLPDPDGVDESPPPRDPLEPVIDDGRRFFTAEKSYTLDHNNKRTEPTFTKFEMPQQQKPPPDLNAGAVDAALNHRRFQRD